MKASKLTEKDIEWAAKWDVSAERLERMREEMIDAEKRGSYRFYGMNIEDMNDAEVKVHYMNMRNYQSDCR